MDMFQYIPREITTHIISLYPKRCWFSLSKQLYRLASVTINKNRAIENAARLGKLEVVELCLQNSKGITASTYATAIGQACRYGHLAIVNRLLEEPTVDPSADDQFAIRWASMCGHVDIVERLLQDRRVDPSVKKNVAIRTAAAEGHANVVQRLLQDRRVGINDFNQDVFTMPVQRGHVDVVEVLMKDPRITQYAYREALIAAIRGRKEDMTAMLVKHSPQNTRMAIVIGAETCYSWTYHTFHLDLVKQLLAHPDVDSASVQQALCEASNEQIITALLEDPRVNPTEALLASLRSRFCSSSTLELLLKDPRTDPSANDNIAICIAADRGKLDFVELLLQDPRVDPSRALDAAVKAGNHQVVDRLLQDSRIDPTEHKAYQGVANNH